MNLGFPESIEDSMIEQSLAYVWSVLADTVHYCCSMERVFILVFFGRMHKLRQAGKVSAWILCVTIPFYIETCILLAFLHKSLEKGVHAPNQINALFFDLSFMIVIPLALIVYGKKQRSSLILCYLYVQLMMALYSFYVRWRNHTENRIRVDTRVLFYEDTDSLRYLSVGMTLTA